MSVVAKETLGCGFWGTVGVDLDEDPLRAARDVYLLLDPVADTFWRGRIIVCEVAVLNA